MNKKRRMLVDCAMTVLLPLLMAYSLIGEAFHEIAGTVMLALFVLHHVLNRSWFRALGKGRYTARRVFQDGLDLLLVVFMVLQPVSGILMSKYLYTFLHIPGVSAWAREVHLCLAYWGLVLLCVHAGTHLYAPMEKLHGQRPGLWRIAVGLSGAVSAYGCYAFVKREIPAYLFRRTLFAFFDDREAIVFFLMDYLAVMVLFATVGLLAVCGFVKKGKRASQRKSGSPKETT